MSHFWKQFGSIRPILLGQSLFPKFTRHGASLTAPAAIPSVVSKAPAINHSPETARQRKRLPTRVGLIGIKRGMVSWFDENNNRFPCTVLEIDAVEVTHTKTAEKDGYYAVQLGAHDKIKNVNKPLLGHFARATVSPKARVMEFQVKDENGLLPLGTQLNADHFKVGQFVDLKSVTRGKGFAGVMKRWDFKGMRATHGTSVVHRHGGSYGANQTPGRVLPGKKMPGHMGSTNHTIQNSKVVHVDVENGYILVKGPVSGSKGSYIKVQDAIKKYA